MAEKPISWRPNKDDRARLDALTGLLDRKEAEILRLALAAFWEAHGKPLGPARPGHGPRKQGP
jgi:hypothetical protein